MLISSRLSSALPCDFMDFFFLFFSPLSPVADQASREEGMQYSQSVDIIIIE